MPLGGNLSFGRLVSWQVDRLSLIINLEALGFFGLWIASAWPSRFIPTETMSAHSWFLLFLLVCAQRLFHWTVTAGKTWLIVAVLYPLRLWIYHKDIHAAVNLSFSFRTPSTSWQARSTVNCYRLGVTLWSVLRDGWCFTNNREGRAKQIPKHKARSILSCRHLLLIESLGITVLRL